MSSFKTVAVAGVSLEASWFLSFTKQGFNVTILTRSKSNHGQVPSGVKVAEVDYSSIDAIAEALEGHDVLIATLAMDAITVQYNLLNAAVLAGVKRYIPSEYSGNTLDPIFSKLLPVAPVMEIQSAVKIAAENGRIEYTIVAPGGFLNLMFNQPIMLDRTNHTANLYDGGNSKVSVSRLSTIAKAVRAVLEQGDRYKNKIVKVQDGTVTQRQMLEIAKKERPEVEWKEIDVDTKTVVDDGLKKLAEGKGTPESVGAMMIASSLSKDVHFGWTEEELENTRLGVEGLTDAQLEALMRKRAQGELVDLPKEYEGAWKIDIK